MRLDFERLLEISVFIMKPRIKLIVTILLVFGESLMKFGECLGPRGGSSVSVMFWGCLSYKGVGTLEVIVGNIGSEKNI
jgi:hypothetical protein